MEIIKEVDLAIILLNGFLAGLIWVIQVVHYPLFRFLDERQFAIAHKKHQMRISLLVIPTMTSELLLKLYRSYETHEFFSHWSLGLTLLVWLSTFFLSVPRHQQLELNGYDLKTIDALVLTNWPRTFFWTLALALEVMLWRS